MGLPAVVKTLASVFGLALGCSVLASEGEAPSAGDMVIPRQGRGILVQAICGKGCAEDRSTCDVFILDDAQYKERVNRGQKLVSKGKTPLFVSDLQPGDYHVAVEARLDTKVVPMKRVEFTDQRWPDYGGFFANDLPEMTDLVGRPVPDPTGGYRMGYWIQKWYRVTVAKDRVEPIVALFVPRSNSPIEWTEYYPKGVHFRNETPKDAQDVFWREIDRMGPTKQDENDRFHLLKLLERGGRVCVPRTRAVLSIGGDGWLKIEVATIAGANADSPSDRGDSVAPVRPVVLSPTGTAQNLNGVASKEVRGWISEGNTFVEVAIDVPQAESVSLTQWELKDGQKAVAKCIGIVPPENFSGGVSGNTSEFLENGPLPVASLKPAKAVQERRGSQNINVQGFFYPIDVKNSLVIGTELVLRSQKLETPFVTAPDTTYLLLSDGWHWAAKRDKPDALSGVKVPVQTELHLLFVAKSPVPPELSLFSADKRVASVQVSARKSVSDEPTGLALLPAFKAELRGNNPVRIRNPNDFSVLAGLRSDGKGKNLEVPAGGTATAQVPDGKYEIFFVYSNKPDALFQGDDFTLKANGVEIQIVKVVGGNYGIRQVK